MKKFWTDERLEFLKKNYPRSGPRKFATKFKRRFGIDIGEKRAKWAARYYRIQTGSDEWYTIKEFAMIVNQPQKTVAGRVQRGTIRARKFGKRFYIHPDEIDKQLSEFYKIDEKIPWPYYTSSEARKLLGYSTHALANVAKSGLIDAVKIRGTWFYRRDHIDWGINQLKRSGGVVIRWQNLRIEFEAKIDEIPYPVYSVSVAIKKLGIRGNAALLRSLATGKCPGFFVRRKWFIPKILVDRMAIEKRRRGHRLRWQSIVKMLESQLGPDWVNYPALKGGACESRLG